MLTPQTRNKSARIGLPGVLFGFGEYLFEAKIGKVYVGTRRMQRLLFSCVNSGCVQRRVVKP